VTAAGCDRGLDRDVEANPASQVVFDGASKKAVKKTNVTKKYILTEVILGSQHWVSLP
jgi:hypothetical protein